MYTGVRPPKGSVAEKILANAVFECITNTARHADGDELYISCYFLLFHFLTPLELDLPFSGNRRGSMGR